MNLNLLFLLKNFLKGKSSFEVGTIAIVNLERLTSISNVGTFKFEDKRLTTLFKLSLQGLTTTGHGSGIDITRTRHDIQGVPTNMTVGE